MNELDGNAKVPEGSSVLLSQRRLLEAMRATLAAVAADVRGGLLETVGVAATLVEGERSSVVLELPREVVGAEAEKIARAIDMENVEAWVGEGSRVHVGIGPFYTTKDVDQVVLSVTKVIHVMLGMHATDAPAKPKTLSQRALSAVAEVLLAQKRAAQEVKPAPDKND